MWGRVCVRHCGEQRAFGESRAPNARSAVEEIDFGGRRLVWRRDGREMEEIARAQQAKRARRLEVGVAVMKKGVKRARKESADSEWGESAHSLRFACRRNGKVRVTAVQVRCSW